MAQTALTGKIVEAIGSFVNIAVGVAGGSGTTTVVTVPGFHRVIAVVGLAGATSATSPYCDTISGNTFTVTTANNDLFGWIAYGIPKA